MREGWDVKKLSECFRLKSGEMLSANEMKEGEYPVFGGNGIAGRHDGFNLSGSNVIIGRVGALCGNVRHLQEELWLTDNAFRIVDFKYDFDHSFLTYLLNFQNLRNAARQAAQPVISNSSLKDIILTFPKSLSEQKRIVAILDEAFAAIDKAKANLEKNLQNAKELFETYLEKVFADDDWKRKKLNEIAVNLDSRRVPITQNVRNKGTIPYYGASGIVDYVEGYIFDEDLLLISEDGANLLMRTYPIAFSISGKTWVNNHAHVLRFQNKVSQTFVEYYLNSIKLDDYVSGMAQPKLNQTMLNLIPIPFPHLDVQENVVRKLNSLSTEIKKLEATYQQKLTALAELKKSILQKAFAGELTASQPKMYAVQASGVSIAAEAEVAYAKPALSKQQAFLQKLMLASHIVYKLCEEKTFGHTKFMKLFYLCEQVGGMALQTSYKKFAAGPFDGKTLTLMDKEFQKNCWFEVVKTSFSINGQEREATTYKRTAKSLSYKTHFDNYFDAEADTINRVIELFRKEKTDTAEIVATLYYVWKDLAATDAEVSITELIPAFYTFHPEKKKFTPEEIRAGYYFMVSHSVYPDA